MRRYSAFAAKSFQGAPLKDNFVNVMWRDIPQLDLEHGFLTDSIFLVAIMYALILIHKSVYPSFYTAIKYYNSSKLSPLPHSKTSMLLGEHCSC